MQFAIDIFCVSLNFIRGPLILFKLTQKNADFSRNTKKWETLADFPEFK